jgi:tetratricopeptide (TPR) repeat protein
MINSLSKISVNNVTKGSNYWGSVTGKIALSVLCFAFSLNPCFAADPFRTQNQRNIGEKTEAAFKALFEDGNYQQAKTYLQEADKIENNDPMLPALRASLAYTEQDWQTFKQYALKTINIANKIKSDDPLRSNLYLAVGNFLEGAYLFQKEGPIPALAKLQQVFNYFDAAEKIDANDPEFNLIKGYLNLLLAVKFPFSSPEEAISRLQDYAAPKFLVNRGIAIAYRDLNRHDQALEFVNLAIESTPLNPELYYLKGQILRQKGQEIEDIELLNEALKNFEIALAKLEQLPLEAVQKPLQREKRKTLEKIESIKGSSGKPNSEILPTISSENLEPKEE